MISSPGPPHIDVVNSLAPLLPHPPAHFYISRRRFLQTASVSLCDLKQREVVGAAEASRLLRRPYRAPWRHPEV